MFDKKAFRSLSYGLYIVCSQAGGLRAGCVVNTFAQVTSTPAQVSVAVNKENATAGAIAEAGRFTASVLAQDTPMELIGTFGFKTSTETDKFAACRFELDEAGIPYVVEHAVARFSARVVEQVDLGTHMLFIGEVEEAEPLAAGEPMTYAYYHQVKGGKTPPKASSYTVEQAADDEAGADGKAKGRIAWRCTICGHIEYVDELPDDFRCPVCGVGKELFEKIVVE